MFILQSEETIKKAVEKARSIKPRLRVLSFGCYQVQNSKGSDYYTVLCRRDKRGFRTVACNCKAGENGLPCYHAAVAVGLHVVMAQGRTKQTTH